jgi:menaquinone-specific isochorismate synthase
VTIVALDPVANQSPDALRGFLQRCQDEARTKGQAQLASISIEVSDLDPLAVLESIFEGSERHFYAERPAAGIAIAGAEAVFSFSADGPERFRLCQQFVDRVLENSLVVGDLTVPLSGPTFFAAFTFEESVDSSAPFAAATVFVPRWQVAQSAGRTVAVANLRVESNSPIELMVEKVWRAHGKFRSFDYHSADFSEEPRPTRAETREVGPDGSYAQSVSAAVGRIASGEFSKVVLARAKTLTGDAPLNPLRVLNGLRQRFHDCYSFSFANGRGQSFIGASPERLAALDQGSLRTTALAGSIKRGASAREDAALAAELLSSEKDLREHAIVRDTIVSCLSPLGLTPEFPATPQILRLANVQHLQSPIRATLPAGISLLQVVSRLYPTPAVGGLPQQAAVAAIRELESFPRGLYAGAMGWIDARGGGEFFVGLRSALISGREATLFAGAGIVAGSSPEKEFAETELKFRAIQEAILLS